MKISNELISQVVKPTLLGFVVGLMGLFGYHDFVLHKLDQWLHDNPIYTAALSFYLLILGVIGLAGFFMDVVNLKKYFRKFSVVSGYSKPAGLFSGLIFAAIFFGSVQEVIALTICAIMLFGIVWLFWNLEQMVFQEIPDKRKRELTAGLASAGSIFLAIFGFYLAWLDFNRGML